MCRVGDCDPSDFQSETVRTARKEHKCGECSRIIRPGERYEYAIGKWDGYLISNKTCAHCVVAREWLLIVCSGWVYTQVLEELVEHWDYELDLRSVRLGRLIVGMRRKWRDGADEIPDIDAVRASTPTVARAA